MYIFTLYQKIYTPNILFPSTSQEQFIYIPTGANFNNVVEILNSTRLLINVNSFECYLFLFVCFIFATLNRICMVAMMMLHIKGGEATKLLSETLQRACDS